MIGKSSGVFISKVKKALENDRKSSEDAGTFSKTTGDHSKAKISRIDEIVVTFIWGTAYRGASTRYWLPNNTLKKHKALKRNARTHPLFRFFKTSILMKQISSKSFHPTPLRPSSKTPSCLPYWGARKARICVLCVAGVKRSKRLEGRGAG